MTAKLFEPLAIGPVELPNRICVSPMCQYTADGGSATDWHLQHWMQLAISGAGLVMVEATAVEPRGRITHGDLGIYNDSNERALTHGLAAARAVAPAGTKFGIQLAHAGRKASCHLPWQQSGTSLGPRDDPWETVAPSPIPFTDGWHTPRELDAPSIAQTVAAFAQAAQRAVRAGLTAMIHEIEDGTRPMVDANLLELLGRAGHV